MEPATLQLTEKEASWKRHIAVSWNALCNRLSVGVCFFLFCVSLQQTETK